jgi:NADH dehydrogenase
MKRLLVSGGTGFVGKNVGGELKKRNYTVRCIVRPYSKNRQIIKDAGFEPYFANILQYESLPPAFYEVDYVINLVGIIQPYRSNTFYRVHVEATRNMVDLSKKCGVKKFIQMSALGTRPDAISQYHKTKWIAEEYVRQSGLRYTIFRPAVIFGEGSGFVKTMLSLLEKPFFIPIAGSGESRVQPVYVGDVAKAIVDAIEDSQTDNKTIELGGPAVYTYRQIIEILSRARGVDKPKIIIPLALLKMVAFFLEKLMDVPPFTRDQLLMLKEDNVCRDVSQGFVNFEDWCKGLTSI